MELRVVLFSAVAARTVVIRGECFLYRREGFDYACTGGWASDEREYGESGERGGRGTGCLSFGVSMVAGC